MAAQAGEEGDSVRVTARVRPLLPKEKVTNCCNCITVDKSTQQVVVGTRRTFAFDLCFDTEATQEEIYNACGAPLLSGCFEGYNATILAYGQTGSGKTYTMGTGSGQTSREGEGAEEDGIVPKVIRSAFQYIGTHCDEVEFKVSCCYIEIHHEEIRDLLQIDTPKQQIAIRETPDGVIQVAGIHSQTCAVVGDMLRCLNDGSMQRTTAATLMNEQSSRSHSIFTIILEQRNRDNSSQKHAWSDCGETAGVVSNVKLSYRTAKFHLVDLAGSERAKRTGAVGSRLKESVAINGGLLALGNVISALGDPAKRGHHVPYRESKLTRLLQDSLGGNSRTMMVACASCADSDFEETANTLKYAHRARNIRNKAVVNHDPRVAQLASMQDEIQALRDELRRVSTTAVCQAPEASPIVPGGDVELLKELTEKLEGAEQRHVEVVEKLVSAETEAEALQRVLAELYSTLCRQLPALVPGTGVGAQIEARQAAAKAVCKVMRSAKCVLGESSFRAEGDQPIPEVPALSGVEGEVPPEAGAGDAAKGLENSLSSAGDTGRLASLAEMRKDATPLLRKYLDEIKRLEAEVTMYRRRTQQLQKDLSEARDDLQKDEEIFDEKMREMKDLADHNLSLDAQLQDALKVAGRASLAPARGSTFVSSESRSLAARLEECDEVRTEEPDLSTAGSVMNGQVFGSSSAASLDEHVDEAVQVELDESMHTQRSLEMELQQLGQKRSMKEELISELVRSEQEWGTTKAQYQKLIEQLQADLEQMQRDLAIVQGQLQESIHVKEQKNSKSEEKGSLDKRIAAQTDAIKKKQQEFSRLRELRHQDSRRIRDLEAEVAQVQNGQRDLDRRLMAERKRTGRLEDLKTQQISCLQTRLQKEGQKVKDLEAENLRFRESFSKDQKARGPVVIARPVQKRLPAPGQKSGGAMSSRPSVGDSIATSASVVSASTPQSLRATRLEEQIDDHIRHQEVCQSLEEDIRKRDALLRKREQYLSYRRTVSAKDAINQQELRDQLKHLASQIDQLDPDIQAVADSALAESPERAQREDLAAEISRLSESGRCKHEEGLSVMREVDDKLECLQDEIDFREARIEKAQQLLRPSQSSTNLATAKPVPNSLAGPLDVELAGLPPDDAKELLTRYCDKLVRLRQREKHTAKRLTAAEAQLEERSRHVSELKEVLRKQDANSTKALAKVTKEYESRIRILLRQQSAAQQNGTQEPSESCNAASASEELKQGKFSPSATTSGVTLNASESSEMQQLQRDNQYFKSVNRELKRRLRGLLERAEGGTREQSSDRAHGSDAVGKQRPSQSGDVNVKVARPERGKEALERASMLEASRTAMEHSKSMLETQLKDLEAGRVPSTDMGEENAQVTTQLKQYHPRFNDQPLATGSRTQPGAPGPTPSDVA